MPIEKKPHTITVNIEYVLPADTTGAETDAIADLTAAGARAFLECVAVESECRPSDRLAILLRRARATIRLAVETDL